MNVRLALATIFSRVSAPPPPFSSRPVARRLVRAVDVDLEITDTIQLYDRNATGPQPLGRSLGARDGAFELVTAIGKQVDETIRGAAGADADETFEPDLVERGARCRLLFRVLSPSCGAFRRGASIGVRWYLIRMQNDYLKMILKAPVYDVARETPLDAMPEMSARLDNGVVVETRGHATGLLVQDSRRIQPHVEADRGGARAWCRHGIRG